MIFYIQFSLTDIRKFLSDDDIFLTSPTWPIPDENKEFVKGSGKIILRKLHRQELLKGEQFINTLKRGIKLPKYIYVNDFKMIFEQKSKHLTIGENGILSKFEFCYKLREDISEKLCYKDIVVIIRRILALSMRIRNIDYKYTEVSIGDNLKALKEFHMLITTKHKMHNKYNQQNIIPCIPQFYFVLNKNDYANSKLTNVYKQQRLQINNEIQNIDNKLYRIFIEEQNPDTDNLDINAVRINLLSMYSEIDNLKNIFRGIIKGNLSVKPFSIQSNILQLYLKNTMYYFNHEIKSSKHEAINFAKDIFNWFSPQDIKMLRERIINFDLRRQIEENTLKFIESVSQQKNINMKIKKSIVGTIVVDSENVQIGDVNISSVEKNVDYDKLSNELGRLFEELKNKADKTEEFEALLSVSKAKDAASERNVNKVASALKSTGQWVLGVAKDIGADMIVALLKNKIGID